MPSQVQKQKPAPQKTVTETVEPQVDADAQRLKDEADALLDEIDSLLEVNAEEFVAQYIQKGGE